MKTVYLVVGVPGSGKSWCCEQLQSQFYYVHHDGYIGHINQPEKYVAGIVAAAAKANRPILAEAPFSISAIKDPLEKQGFDVRPVFILEPEGVLRARYLAREKKEIPKGHLTRQKTYAERAALWKSFVGTSTQVHAYLRGIK